MGQREYFMNINSHVLEIIQGVIGKYCETQTQTQSQKFSITLINKLQCNYVCLQIPPEQMIAQCEPRGAQVSQVTA